MRNIFVKILTEKADKDTYLIIGDLGFGAIEPFAEKYPAQFLNAGVAEQNMTGMAAGLALTGFKVFTYSIGNFNTTRCLEQIRNDICYHNLDVTIVSVGPGFAYGSQGYSHHAVQDIALMGCLPNMKLLLPGDSREVEFAMDYIFREKGPKYLRLGKNCEKIFHQGFTEVKKINHFNAEEKGEIALITASTTMETAFSVAELLKKQGITSNVFSCPVIDSDFNENVRRELFDFDYVFIIEEHISNLGFAAFVRSAFDGQRKMIKSFGLKRDSCKIVGTRDYLCERHGISATSITNSIKKILSENNL
jgi:transketolase